MTINDSTVWRFKVVLNETKPMVWRLFDTYSTVSLSQLHYCKHFTLDEANERLAEYVAV